MWLMTRFGFFSIVNKADGSVLTVRSRTRGDLDRLRNHYLPSLSPGVAHGGTDYPWRATVGSEELGAAMLQICRDIDYPNFKDEVAISLGADRAHRYGEVWAALYDMPEDLPEPTSQVGMAALPWKASAPAGNQVSYGGIVISPTGQVLMREMQGHIDGYVWTHAKTGAVAGEEPRETARRAVFEKTGLTPRIITPIPDQFKGGTSISRYFLMIEREARDISFENEVTASLRWVSFDEARRMIEQTTNLLGRERDIAALDAARACLPAKLPLARPITRFDAWTSKPMPAAKTLLKLNRDFSHQQMPLIFRGFLPQVQEEKWFAYYEDGVLSFFRSWTGFCLFRVHFRPMAKGWKAFAVEVNPRPRFYSGTDDEALEQVTDLLDNLMLRGPSEPTVDGFVLAITAAAHPGYLGSPSVVSALLKDFFHAAEHAHEEEELGAVMIWAEPVVEAMDGTAEGYLQLPGWHTVDGLGKALAKAFNLDPAELTGKSLADHIFVGLEAVVGAVQAIVNSADHDEDAESGGEVGARLRALQLFVRDVFLGTNSVTFPGRSLGDFGSGD